MDATETARSALMDPPTQHRNCRPPSAFRTRKGVVWTCACGKAWRCTHGRIPSDRGWERI